MAGALDRDERSVAWLSRQTGIKRTTLTYQIKAGYFPVESLLSIATAFGVPPEALFAEVAA